MNASVSALPAPGMTAKDDAIVDVQPWLESLATTQHAALTLPFDMARHQYARAVTWGWIQPSLRASARFGNALALLERCLLGKWARQV